MNLLFIEAVLVIGCNFIYIPSKDNEQMIIRYNSPIYRAMLLCVGIFFLQTILPCFLSKIEVYKKSISCKLEKNNFLQVKTMITPLTTMLTKMESHCTVCPIETS